MGRSMSRSQRTASRWPLGAAIAVVLAGAAFGTLGCAKDVILPVDSVCGDGKKQGNEECDVDSEGCVECQIVKGFSCTDATCTTICGDGLKVGDEECDPPDDVLCDSSCHSGMKAEACDMTGYWLLRQTTFSIDTVVNQVQTATNWYVYKLSQTGTAFQVDQGISCGIRVTGSATVDLTDPGIRGLVHENPQDTRSSRGPRKGTFGPSGSGCTFEMDRNYMVRGGDPSLLAPVFSTKPELSTLTPLPSESNPEHPTKTNLAGAEDTDGDGEPGVAFRISGNASGVRNVVQRDWNEYFTDTNKTIPANAIELVAAVRFDNQENVLSVSKCPLVGCGILLAGSHPDPNLLGRATFRYLGKELSDPGVSRIIVKDLTSDVDADVQTCANERDALPHDPSMH